MFIVTWGLRRIAFTLGAVLLVGGWGLTGYVDAHQQAAGPEAGALWRDGVAEASAVEPPMAPPRVATPSSWLYLFGVTVMTAGAALIALTVPWRGERKTVAAPVVAPVPVTPVAPASPSVSQGPSLPGVNNPPLGSLPAGPQETSGPRAAKPLFFKRGA